MMKHFLMILVMLFWPAWAQTLHNADIAIQATNDRNYHLINIMTIYDPVRDNRALMRQGQRMLSGRCTLGIDC